MLYDHSDGGKNLRTYASVNLAPWHNFKHGVELIWKHWSLEVFAPMYHYLYPQNKFAIKYQSPQEPLIHMMLLCNAYPAFKSHLQNALQQEGMSIQNLCLLRDIEFLCEYAIPVVLVFARERMG
jgi:hypothetical protein